MDPTAVCDGDVKWDTPMEIAATRGHSEVLKILAEFTEIPDKVKLIQMSLLMNSDKPKRSKEKFQSMLESLPVDLVSTFVAAYPQFLFCSGEQHRHWRREDALCVHTFAEGCLPEEQRLC